MYDRRNSSRTAQQGGNDNEDNAAQQQEQLAANQLSETIRVLSSPTVSLQEVDAEGRKLDVYSMNPVYANNGQFSVARNLEIAARARLRPSDPNTTKKGVVRRFREQPTTHQAVEVAILAILIFFLWKFGILGMLWSGLMSLVGGSKPTAGPTQNLTPPAGKPLAVTSGAVPAYSATADSSYNLSDTQFGGKAAQLGGDKIKASWDLLKTGTPLAINTKAIYSVLTQDSMSGFFGASSAPLDNPANFASTTFGYAAATPGNWMIGEFVSTKNTDLHRFVSPVYVGSNVGDAYGLIWIKSSDTTPVSISRLTEGSKFSAGFVQVKSTAQ